jgi:adenine deaminase
LQQGNDADLILVDRLDEFNVLKTFIRGELVAADGNPLLARLRPDPVNHFEAGEISGQDITVSPASERVRVIEAIDGQLITRALEEEVMISNGNIISDPANDILKLLVINRYKPSLPSIGFIKGFGLKTGAIASTVAHDSHNIIAVGVEDRSLVEAVNLLVREKGGIACVGNSNSSVMPLPFGGIMSGGDGYVVARQYEELDAQAKSLGSALHAPFMTLSFMALLVIPELKLSDQGLFNGKEFTFTSLFVQE